MLNARLVVKDIRLQGPLRLSAEMVMPSATSASASVMLRPSDVFSGLSVEVNRGFLL